jgi:hypothetical protein
MQNTVTNKVFLFDEISKHVLQRIIFYSKVSVYNVRCTPSENGIIQDD